MTYQACDFCKEQKHILFEFRPTSETTQDKAYQQMNEWADLTRFEICLECIAKIPRR